MQGGPNLLRAGSPRDGSSSRLLGRHGSEPLFFRPLAARPAVPEGVPFPQSSAAAALAGWGPLNVQAEQVTSRAACTRQAACMCGL